MLIHATITVSGDAVMRIACEARLRRLLSHQFLKNEVTEHHGPEALCYDLKVEGGIPFPLFAQASQEFAELTFDAQWVNVEKGEKGGATIIDGRVTAQENERIALSTTDDHPVHVEVTPEGRLRLALTLVRAGRDEWRGYAVTATRDALLRISREPGSGMVEIHATDGSADWELAWRVDRAGAEPAVIPGQGPIENEDYRELEAIARRFAGEWIWMSSGGQEEIAIETDRYRVYGYPVASANVRSARLHRMRSEAEPGATLVHTTLGAEDLWVKDLVLASWAKLS
jgi:hypothetical protein